MFVTSATTAEPHVTKIGDVTESRLYSFDLEALEHLRASRKASGGGCWVGALGGCTRISICGGAQAVG